MRAGIDPQRARPSADIRPGSRCREGDNTTHFSVVDRFGNAVANTYTLNFSYGVGLVAEGTGVLLQQRARRFRRQAGSARTPMAWSAATPMRPGPASGRCRR